MRINNLEFIEESSYLVVPPEHKTYIIYLCKKDNYYQTEEDFAKQENRLKHEARDYIEVHNIMYYHPDIKYSLGIFNWKNNHYEFSFYDDRPIRYLDNQEWEDFRKLIKFGFAQLNSEYRIGNLQSKWESDNVIFTNNKPEKNEYYERFDEFIKDGEFYHPFGNNSLQIHEDVFKYPGDYICAVQLFKDKPARYFIFLEGADKFTKISNFLENENLRV